MRFRSTSAIVAALLVGGPGVLQVAGWLPPPAEFADVTAMADIDFPVEKWTPSQGEATSLLDVLPPGSPAAADFNRDGYPDLFFPSPRYTDAELDALRRPISRLYMNDASTYELGGEKFRDVTDVAGLDVHGYAYAASWADVDNDGFPDLFVGGYRMARLFHNDGDGTFTEVTAASGLPQDGFVLGGAWGDFDADGRVDLLLVQFADYAHPDDGLPDFHDLPGKANVLLRNLDGLRFADVSAAAGLAGIARRSTSASFVDADADGLQDVYVTNYGQPAELWRNLGNGQFEEVAAQVGLADGADATCQSWEDLDRDGRLDLFVGHEDGTQDGVWLANDQGTFDPRGSALGLDPLVAGDAWSCFAFDYDGDGDMDLFVANSAPQEPMRQRSSLLVNMLNEGHFHYEDGTDEAGNHNQCGYTEGNTLTDAQALTGAAAVDFDMHGTPDVITTAGDGDAARLFKNVGWVGFPCGAGWAGGSGYHFKVLLRGTASNRDGLGARITMTAGDLAVTRQLGAGMGWGSQSLTDLQFGAWKGLEAGYGTSNVNEDPFPIALTIRWPSGAVETFPAQFAVSTMVQFTEGLGWKNDTAPPRPQFALLSGAEGENGWYTSPSVRFKLSAIDARGVGGSAHTTVAKMRYSLDGTTWVNVAAPKTGVTLTFAGEGTRPLWIELEDAAVLEKPDHTTLPAPNRAVYLYPIRIDSQAPTLQELVPAPGGVYAQGRELTRAAGVPKAVVLAPHALDASSAGQPGQVVQDALGSDGTQRVQAVGTADAASGVWKATYELRRSNGQLVATATERLAPYAWGWPASQFAAGEYLLTARVLDAAGNAAVAISKVVVVPTEPGGVTSTITQGPSLPTV